MEGAMLPSYGLAEGEDDMVCELCLKTMFLSNSYCLIIYLCFPSAPPLTFEPQNWLGSLSHSVNSECLSNVVTLAKL